MTRYRLKGFKFPNFHCRGNDAKESSTARGGNEASTLIPVEEENPIFDDWNFLWKSCHQEEGPDEGKENGEHGQYPLSGVGNSNSPKLIYTGKENCCITGNNKDTATSSNLPATGNYSASKDRESAVALYPLSQQYSAVPSGLVEQIRNGLFTNFTGIAAACEATAARNTSDSSSKDVRQKQEGTPPFPRRSYTVGEPAVVISSTGEEPTREKGIQPYNFSRASTGIHNQQFSRPSHSLPVNYLLGENEENCSHLISYTVEEDIDIVEPAINHYTNNNYSYRNNGASFSEVTGYFPENTNSPEEIDGAAFEAKERTPDPNVGSGAIFGDISHAIKSSSLERGCIINDATNASNNCLGHEVRPLNDRKGEITAGINDYHLEAISTAAAHANINSNSISNTLVEKGSVPSSKTKEICSSEVRNIRDNFSGIEVSEHQHSTRPRPAEFPYPIGRPGSFPIRDESGWQNGPNYLCKKHSNPAQSAPANSNTNQSWVPEIKPNPLNITTAVSDSWSYLPAQEVSATDARRNQAKSVNSASPVSSPPYSPSKSVVCGTRRCSSARSTAGESLLIDFYPMNVF